MAAERQEKKRTTRRKRIPLTDEQRKAQAKERIAKREATKRKRQANARRTIAKTKAKKDSNANPKKPRVRRSATLRDTTKPRASARATLRDTSKPRASARATLGRTRNLPAVVKNQPPATISQSSKNAKSSRVRNLLKKIGSAAGKVGRVARAATPLGLATTAATMAVNSKANQSIKSSNVGGRSKNSRRLAAQRPQEENSTNREGKRLTRRGYRRTRGSSTNTQSPANRPPLNSNRSQGTPSKPKATTSPKRSQSPSSSKVPRNVVTGKPLSSFERAFVNARRQGLKTFPYKGKTYSTRRADGKPMKKKGSTKKNTNQPKSRPQSTRMYRKQFMEDDMRKMEKLANQR